MLFCCHQADINKLLDKLRYDTKPPVREAAQAAIQAMAKMQILYDAKHQDEIEQAAEDGASDHAELHTSMGEGEENEGSSQLAQSGHVAAAAPVERIPMQNLKSSVNRVHSNKSELSIEALSSKPMRLAASKGVEREREGGLESTNSSCFAQSAMRDESMPTKETWNQLLLHFDRMTQQQTQLIEMVSSFGDSSRERLESLEQKVYSIELRLSGMEQRQSFGLPGMPPTPARARGVFHPSHSP
jgi:hypothetical protein